MFGAKPPRTVQGVTLTAAVLVGNKMYRAALHPNLWNAYIGNIFTPENCKLITEKGSVSEQK